MYKIKQIGNNNMIIKGKHVILNKFNIDNNNK